MPDPHHRALDILPVAADGRSAVEVAQHCAVRAGELIREAYRLSREDLGTKGRGDIVTSTDMAVELLIQQILSQAYPDHALLSEETNSTMSTGGWVWVVDPIDGTTNFFQGIPFFCVNIALCRDGVPLLALTYDPLQQEEFLAVQGAGVRVNGVPVQATERPFSDATAIFDSGHGEVARSSFDAFHHLGWEVLHSRVMGSAALALAYVAAARADLFVFAGAGGAWDIAAGILLVQEAGGVITDHRKGPITISSEGVVAGSAAAHAGFFERVKNASWYR